MKLIPRRRRLEAKTNYTKRKRLLEGRKPRIVIRKTNRYIIIQYVESKAAQDSVKLTVTSKELLSKGWPESKAGSLKSLGAAYLTGLLFGKEASKLKPGILDSGLIRSTNGSRIYAAVKGIKDSGLNMPCGEKVFPAQERITKDADFFEKVKKAIENK
ncbi:50S ribosomal protein L18 [Candidatus Pacearchaeota archaeon]|nr:50S ribosomal protein L18 [Candidatus Pacearchaeota archaeon]